jgi:hypothetical protein
MGVSDSNGSDHKWPHLPYLPWRNTCAALHLWSQIVGKYRLAHTPWVNHSWHATLYVTPRGLTTGPVPDTGHTTTIDFDFHDHRLLVCSDRGASESFALEPMSIADFFERTKRAIAKVGGSPTIHGHPNEVPDPLPFAEDRDQRPYDAAAVERFHQALVRIDRVLNRFRTAFIGKVSPVHQFWGAFDLAVTRFSGRPAPIHPGGIPNLPDAVTREAYSHEVSSTGFWPGGMGVDEPMFYAYAYPIPRGFSEWHVEPVAAGFDEDLGEFLLPYAAVREAKDPEGTLLRFLVSTYEAAAVCGRWDRRALECEIGAPRVPRPIEQRPPRKMR